MESTFFGVRLDASNKGNQKCFSIAVRYFNVQADVCHGILDFYEDSDETALSEQILDRIPKYRLNLILYLYLKLGLSIKLNKDVK